ncbi:tail fiber domain-containing protein [bacterium]|nr:tail fiber domain-containing protein [bacterium]
MKAKLAILVLLSAAPWTYAASTVPKLMSYQGRVTDSAGVAIGSTAAVNRTVTFSLYASPSGSDLSYRETQSVTISGGEFSVLIGNGTGVTNYPGPTSPASSIKTLDGVINSAATSALYLGITVDDGNSATQDTEISPRQQLVTGAYSVRALMAESVASGAVTSTMLGNNSVGTDQLAAGSINSVKLGALAVESGNILGGAVTAAKIDTTTVGVWTPSGNNIYRSSNVGIGVTSPAAVLEVAARTGTTTTPATNGLRVVNSTNTAGNNAVLAAGVAGSSAGSPFVSLDISGINGWSIGTDNADADKLVFKNSWDFTANPKMAIDVAGNVGIGTTSPTEKLTVSGGSLRVTNTINPCVVVSNATNQAVLGFATNAGAWSTYSSINDVVLRSDSSKVIIQSGAGAAGLVIDSTNKVGIGTAAPAGKFAISETTGTAATSGVGSIVLDHENAGGASSIVFRSKNNRDGGDYGFIQYQDDTTVNGTGETAKLIIGTSNDTDDHLILAPSGFVGIGTYSPTVPLTVGTTANYSVNTGTGVTSGNGTYLQEGNPDVYSADGTKGVNTATPMSIYAAGGVIAQFVVFRSDERIKDIVSQSVTSEDLKQVNQLAIHNYKMKDRIANGESVYKGLIAQQVEQVMPEAVTRSEDYIPDIYSRATGLDFDSAKNQLTVDLGHSHKLVAGDWVRLHTEKGLSEVEIVATPSDSSFVVAAPEAVTEVFVYGHRVNDLLAVDYDRVFTTGIGAIQELSKKLDEKETVIAALEARLSALEKRVSAAK